MRTLLFSLSFLLLSSVVGQDVYLVTNLADSGPGSLRNAINSALDGDAVIIGVAGTLNLSSPISINKNIVIQGPMPNHFKIDASTSGSAFVHNTVALGLYTYIDGIYYTGATNSAIINQAGSLYVGRSVFYSNDSPTGGAISNQGTITVESCSFINNTSALGGAIHTNNDLALLNNTFTGNDGGGAAGAFYSDGGNHLIIHCTFVGNDASIGGAIDMQNGSAELTSNLFFGNGVSATSTDPTLNTGAGTLTSMGGNFIDSDLITLAIAMAPDLTDVFGSGLDPLLGPLVTDGYGMEYYTFTSNASPAIDIGGNAALMVYDQRRGYRIMQGNASPVADAGAIEYTPFIVTTLNGIGTGMGAPNGSLGWAIDGANTAPNPPYSICFDLPAPNYTIPAMGSYVIDRECIIDGYTQVGSAVPGPANIALSTPVTVGNPLVEIDGTVVSGASGLIVQGDTAHQIRGLSIYNFGKAGLLLTDSAGTVLLEGLHIGVDATGASLGTGNKDGIVVTKASNNSQIGDWFYHSRNVISNNDSIGVVFSGSGTSFNDIYNSFVGVNGLGQSARPNTIGVLVHDSANTTLIGDSLLYGNVISGNTGAGVVLGDTLSDINGIYGNRIGTDVTGTVAIGNHKGVVVSNRSNLNAIGGITRARGNIISGNDSCGIQLSTWANLIQANYIGVDITGNNVLANGADGIFFPDPVGVNIIGGSVPGQGNIISGNGHHGINLQSSSWTAVLGNIIGLAADTLSAIPNHGDGVRLDTGSVFVGIGSDILSGYNVIAANDSVGINLVGTDGGHTIAGNFIGCAYVSSALTPYGNGRDGIRIEENSFWSTRIGDSLNTGAINFIGFNNGDGISIINDNNNRLYRNAIFYNSELGIDLGNDGVTPNDPMDSDFGTNSLLNYPVLTSAVACANGVVVEGTLNTEPNKPFRIEFFANDALDPSGFGEGIIYLGSYKDSTDAAGNMSFTAFVSTPVPAGWFVTATSTIETVASNTSEFSQGISVSSATIAPIASADVSICEGDSTLSISAAPQSGGVIVWATDNAFVNVIDTSTTILVGGVAGTYVYYAAEVVSGLCLSAYDSVLVTVVPYDDPTFQFDDYCAGTLNGPYGEATPGGTYSFVTPVVDGAAISPTIGTIVNGVGGTTYQVQYITPGLCPDTSVVPITVFENPIINGVTVSNEACEGDQSGGLTISASGGLPAYQYSIDGGITWVGAPMVSGLGNGSYTVSVEDMNGCVGNDVTTVGFDVANTLSVIGQRTTCPEFAIQLQASGTGTFLWYGAPVSDSLLPNPYANPQFSTTYYVNLTDGSCVFTDSVQVTVTPGSCDEIIPNAFSPNNDGVNDIWEIPFLSYIPNNMVRLFNRWGDEIIAIKQYNNTDKAWDGRNKSGDLMPAGTYFYTIELPARDLTFSGWIQITY